MDGSRNVVVGHRMVDIGTAGQRVAADVFLPAAGRARSFAFCCLPGGGMSRRYWDLRPAGDETYSFAVRMAGAGFPVISVDHVGTGDSALGDGATTPLLRQVVAANDAAFRVLLDELRHTGFDGADPVPGLRRIGIGHSMGATMTIRQQAAHRTYDAVALLGFGTEGLPAQLPPAILAACTTGVPGDERLAELTREMFGSAYPMLPGNGNGASQDDETATDPVAKELDAVTTVLLGAGGLLSMLPGNVAADAARLRVPVLVANGEHDRLVDGRQARAEQYPLATSFVNYLLPGSGHNHNAAPTRQQLWDQLLHWAESVVPN